MTKRKTQTNTIDAFLLTILVHKIMQVLEQCPPGTRFESVDRLYCGVDNLAVNALEVRAVSPDNEIIEKAIEPFNINRNAPWHGWTEEEIAEIARDYGMRELKRRGMKLRIYYKPIIDGQVAEHHSSVTVPLEEGQDGRFQLAVQILDELLGAGNYDYLYHERVNDDEPEGDALIRLVYLVKKERYEYRDE